MPSVTEPIWTPPAGRVAASNLTRFAAFARDRHGAPQGDYEVLWRWSVDERETFWTALVDFAGIIRTAGRAPVLRHRDRMPGAVWFNSANYIHTVYQAMNLAFADRDFYYGDPNFPPDEPRQGLLSKEYAKSREATMRMDRNDATAGPGDPYPFQGGQNPHADLLEKQRRAAVSSSSPELSAQAHDAFKQGFQSGTTTVVSADAQGWLVAMTPSGGWIPATIAGRTGIGLSQRMQSFVLDPALNPYNLLEPGKRPRVTLTPSLAFKDGQPWLAFAVQGGDSQDQNLLQFFLNVVEFGMTPQEAAEAANFNSFQMRSSFDKHESQPGRIVLNESIPQWVRRELVQRGYKPEFEARTSGPINAILLDHAHGTMWGGSSNHGEDYGIAW